MAAALSIAGVRLTYPGPWSGSVPRTILDDVSLEVGAGEFFCLLGPSGCGKTSLLKVIGGYATASAGRVCLADRDITSAPPERRDIGMVFQSYALFPHLGAWANVEFGLVARQVPRRQRQRQVAEILQRVGLERSLWRRRPSALSGGEQQRVALARALVIEPLLLLLDEPFTNLDRRLRDQLRRELRALQARTGVTTILVTHDQDEALSLGNRVAVMRRGGLEQVGPPLELYRRPRSRYLATFLGEANILETRRAPNGEVRLAGGAPVRAAGLTGEGDAAGTFLVRPEEVVLGPAARECPNHWLGRLQSTTFLGSESVWEVGIGEGEVLLARCRPWPSPDAGIAGDVWVGIPAAAAWRLPEVGE